MTEFLEVEGGRIAYEVTGDGPLVMLLPGMGIRRDFYSSLARRLVAAGYRVAAADLRGLGESSTGWSSYTRTDTAADTLALIRHLGGPAVIVGHSFSGGSATIAAAQAPEMVTAIVEIGPFTRVPKLSPGALLTNPRYRKGTLLLHPRAEAGGIVAAMPAGLGRATMIDGAGHYPHTQFPDQVAAAILPFLKEHAGA